LGTGTSYKGVFLNQGGPDIHNLNSAYYSIYCTTHSANNCERANVYRCVSELVGHNSAFQTQLTANRCVFTSSGATAAANTRHRISPTPPPLFQRQPAEDCENTRQRLLHQVYESSINGVNHVWYEVSKDTEPRWTLQSPTSMWLDRMSFRNPGPLDTALEKILYRFLS